MMRIAPALALVVAVVSTSHSQSQATAAESAPPAGVAIVGMDDSDAKRDRVLKEALGCRVELVAYARAVLGNYTAAEHVVQEAMLVVVTKFDQFQEGTSMLAWCRDIVRLEVLRMKHQWQRDRTLSERLLDDAVDAAFDEFQTAERRDDVGSWQEALERCSEQVPNRGRSVLKARFVVRIGVQRRFNRHDFRELDAHLRILLVSYPGRTGGAGNCRGGIAAVHDIGDFAADDDRAATATDPGHLGGKSGSES